MKRLIIYAGLALAVFSCTYGGNDSTNNTDTSNTSSTTNTILPIDSTGAYGTGNGTDTGLGTGSGIDTNNTSTGTGNGVRDTASVGATNRPATIGGGQ
jgi:hypothetical protein